MRTTVDAGHGFRSGINRGALRIWLRLFLGISGGAVAIAVALGLVVVLAAAASQAEAAALSDHRHAPVAYAVTPVAEGSKGLNGPRPRTRAADSPVFQKVLAAPAAASAAAQLAAGTVLLGLGFGCLLSRRGSRLLAGGAAAEER